MQATNRIRDVLRKDWPIMVFLVIGAFFALEATGYKSGGGFFPMTIGVIMVLMCIAETIWHPVGAFDDMDADESEPVSRPESLRRDAIAIGWLVMSLAICFGFGMLIGIAIGTAVYFLAIARKSLPVAILVGAVLTFCIWLGMEQLAGFRLNTGFFW